ncbi:hypothetical protein M514_02124 [Trichuris suis]|uniref:RNase H type-1 domain-containing protein n=1 Tax=Trichuris suis TaxID=68888 RepID=A0A085MI21_9BILA|nr:hypothetical protein M513_02124 [Trichuris suis]KFD61711.1 hypothetical protein M514_02124 [Trichuris suis]
MSRVSQTLKFRNPLDAVTKGLNLALSWQMNEVELMADSSTVLRWTSDSLLRKGRLRTKAASEMIIRRRIGILLSLVEECGLALNISLVKSADNKADCSVPQRWSGSPKASAPVRAATVSSEVQQIIAKIRRDAGHPGSRRTLYFVGRVCLTVSKQQVLQVIIYCEACQSIDPAPAK